MSFEASYFEGGEEEVFLFTLWYFIPDFLHITLMDIS